MDTNQVIENSEEVVENATEAIAEAGWTGSDVAAGFGVGVFAGVLLTKFVIAPIYRKVVNAIRNRPPKEILVSVKADPPAEEPKETETESGEESEKK